MRDADFPQDTKLADRTATLASQPIEEDTTTPTASTKTIRPGTPKSKGTTAAEVASPSSLAQIRAELASTQRTRGELETKLTTVNSELTTLKASDTLQKQRIEQLEKVKANPHTRRSPVVVLTTTDDSREVQRCYDLGANVYITKPVNYEGFANAIRQLGLFFSVMQVPENP